MATERPDRRPHRPLRRLRRTLEPVREARGLPKWLLYAGASSSLVFVVLAVFAPLISPYGFDQYQRRRRRLPQVGRLRRAPLVRHQRQGDRRAVPRRLRRPHRARGHRARRRLLVVVGVPLGLISGYFGGWLDRVLVLVTDALFAFPSLLLAIVISFLLASALGQRGGVHRRRPSPSPSSTCRSTSGSSATRVISAREEPYVEAARALGARPRDVIALRVRQRRAERPVIATLNAADAILTLAGLGFLGYGIQPTEAAEWGYDLQRALATPAPASGGPSLYPGLAIVLLVIGLTLVGESLNDVLNPSCAGAELPPVMLPPRAVELDAQSSAARST